MPSGFNPVAPLHLQVGTKEQTPPSTTIDPAHPTSPVNLQIQIVTIAKHLEQSEQPAQPAAPGPKEPKKKR